MVRALMFVTKRTTTTPNYKLIAMVGISGELAFQSPLLSGGWSRFSERAVS